MSRRLLGLGLGVVAAAMAEAVGARRRAAAVLALLALCAVAAAVLSARAVGGGGAQGGLEPASGGGEPTALVSKTSGTKRARTQLVGEEDSADDEGDGEEEPEEPPYGESVELPEPACDIEAMQNCLGAMQALEQNLPDSERMLLRGGEDSEVAHEFCSQAKVPFQCACQACDLSKLSTWNNDYWTRDREAKGIITHMRAQARCHELHQNGEANFEPGHGCYDLFKTVCEKPLKSDW